MLPIQYPIKAALEARRRYRAKRPGKTPALQLVTIIVNGERVQCWTSSGKVKNHSSRLKIQEDTDTSLAVATTARMPENLDAFLNSLNDAELDFLLAGLEDASLREEATRIVEEELEEAGVL